MAAPNDVRGWILTALSAVACCIGACIICVDIVVRRFPRMHDFKITESDAFLSASLSLSAGVILFSSLYSMLPASQNYLKSGGYSASAASFLLIGLFLVGVFGIRILSQILHRFIPSHVVDCDHTHDEEANKSFHEEMAEDDNTNGSNGHVHQHNKIPEPETDQTTETTPLVSDTLGSRMPPRTTTAPGGTVGRGLQANSFVTGPNSRRESNFRRTLSRTFSKVVSSKKEECDETGPCMGFSDPCGQDCFKIVQKRNTLKHALSNPRMATWRRTPSEFRYGTAAAEEDYATLENSTGPHSSQESRSATHHIHHADHEHPQRRHSSVHRRESHAHSHNGANEHHHHVPTNAFMSIGLQTSVAIALHKAPEGFITYATNHVNPRLGFSVFVALFIHNITEGFALSLPLFLALNSRFKAILWSAILGGCTQPLGAGVAALWFKLAASNSHLQPSGMVYGGIFAVTSGVMASVALSLISESLQLSHNKNTCIAFAFVGMGLLGISMALTAS